MLVGDVILGARVRMNDLPRTLASPSGITIAAAAGIGATIPAGTYYVKSTQLNGWGETIGSSESGPFTLSLGDGFTVSGTLIPGATGVKVYFGLGSGQENQWISSTVLPFNITTSGLPGVPPTRNSTFYPDVDGQRVNAYTIYGWLNKALDVAAVISGGIPDTTAINSINTVAMYELIGQWSKFDHLWYDGYQVTLSGRNILFYRNLVPGIVGLGVLQQISNRIVIELQPQPSRSGAVTTAANPVGITDTTITATSLANFLLPFGMAILGNPTNPSNCEIIQYSSMNGAVLSGCMRGMGGTVQQAWSAGATLVEGNVRLTGQRSFVAPNYSPGNSYSTLSVPAGWQDALEDFIVARYRESEGNVQEANRLMQSFTNTIKANLNGNKLVAGPRQIGEMNGLDTWPSRGPFGIIVP